MWTPEIQDAIDLATRRHNSVSLSTFGWAPRLNFEERAPAAAESRVPNSTASSSSSTITGTMAKATVLAPTTGSPDLPGAVPASNSAFKGRGKRGSHSPSGRNPSANAWTTGLNVWQKAAGKGKGKGRGKGKDPSTARGP